MIQKKEAGKIAEKKVSEKKRTSRNFVIALSMVSIIGFLSIVLESLFNFSITEYIETLWLITLGMGLIFETSISEIKKIKTRGLSSEFLGKITMIVVGSLAIIAGILSLPNIHIENSVFSAIKGIIGILAIIFIILQTWVTKPNVNSVK